jgi:hypothetical protein
MVETTYLIFITKSPNTSLEYSSCINLSTVIDRKEAVLQKFWAKMLFWVIVLVFSVRRLRLFGGILSSPSDKNRGFLCSKHGFQVTVVIFGQKERNRPSGKNFCCKFQQYC